MCGEYEWLDIILPYLTLYYRFRFKIIRSLNFDLV